MKKQLSIKLLLAFLAVTLLTLALSGVAINWALSRQFQNYIEESKENDNLRILDAVTAYYTTHGSWRGIAPTLAHVGLSTDTFVRLKDNQGILVYDSRQDMRGMMGRMYGTGLGRGTYNFEIEGESFTYPVQVNGEHVGTLNLTILGREGILTEEDINFSRTINLSIYLIAFLASLVAVATSLFFSRRLTQPLTNITGAVSKIREGDFNQRVEVTSEDELGILAQSFNDMASQLGRNEKLRRKLTADIAHELRTPLTTLKSYLEAFKDGVLSPEEENISALQEEVIRLENLVNSLQELSLVESRSDNMVLKEINPAPVIQRIYDLYRPLFLEKRLEAGINLPKENLNLQLNEEALERILHNLLSNAIKYTFPGGKVRLDLQKGEFDNNNCININISDTGPGIGEEDLPYIFERFFRADPSRSRKTGGAGIGLTITKELVEAQGGKIIAKSNPGKGTTFTITFPLK